MKGTTGEDLFVTQELDEERLKKDLEELRQSGIESLSVVLAHSYMSVTLDYESVAQRLWDTLVHIC